MIGDGGDCFCESVTSVGTDTPARLNASHGIIRRSFVPEDGHGPSYTYTLAGRLRTRVWARGVTTTYDYDNAREVNGVTYSDGTPAIAYVRDRLNRITHISDAAGDHVIIGGPANQVGSETIAGGILDGVTVVNGYDVLQRRNTFDYKQNGGSVLTYTYGYDNSSRLASAGNGTSTATYEYVPNSDLVGGVSFKNDSTPVMTTINSYDKLSRLKLTSTANTTGTVLNSFGYDYNVLNQRTKNSLKDGTYWGFGYDELGQVTSGEKRWSDGSVVAGEQFGYAFDNIGNRTSTTTNGRPATYTPNALNQYTMRTVPGAVDIIGTASQDARVTVNGQSAARKGEFFYKALTLDNSGGAVNQTVNVVAVKNNSGPAGEDAVRNQSGDLFIPKTPEMFIYDLDGNLIQDGRWALVWDGENRLVSVTAHAHIPLAARKKLVFDYDDRGRRIQKRVYPWKVEINGYDNVPVTTIKFIYDDWNLVAETSGDGIAQRKYIWGLDLSGARALAGGVGGLLGETHLSGGWHFCTYDGNGNVTGLVQASDGSLSASYEYGPFGELVTSSGPMSRSNPFRFSTKFQDNEDNFIDFGHRFYQSGLGAWLNRDPLEERGGFNLYGFVSNKPIQAVDSLGLLQWEVCVDYYYPEFIKGRKNLGGLTEPFPPRVKAECMECGDGFVLKELHVELPIEVSYAQGVGQQYRQWVKEREHEHEDDLRKWSEERGRPAAQKQENDLKRELYTSTKEQCEAAAAQAAFARISIGWDAAAAKSYDDHDRPGKNHPYHGPVFDPPPKRWWEFWR